VILPSGGDRSALFRNLVRECLVSADTRRTRNQVLRNWYLLGTDGQGKARRNKLAEWVDQSASYCYAPESVRFGVVLPTQYGDAFIEEEDAAREEMHRVFHDTDAALTFGLGVEFAHVYDSVIFKVITNENEADLELVPDPADIGVWRENLDSLDKQEAIVHRFEMDTAAFERLVRGAIADPTLAEEIVREGQDVSIKGTGSTNLAPAVPRILLAAATPNLIGAVQNTQDTALAQPQVRGEVVTLAELWVRDDRAWKDDQGRWHWEWRKVLHLPATERVLWESLNPLLPQRHPFRQLCLNPLPNYLWGVSPMEKLLIMQRWGEDMIGKHQQLLDLQLDPPIAIIGMASVDGERAKLLRALGGTFTMPPAPQASIQRLAPETPPDAAGMSRLIDEWFDRAGGLPSGSGGPQEANVRSAGQMTAGAVLSSPRTNRRAMRVEDTLEEVATDMLRLHRRVSKAPLRIPLAQPDPETAESSRKFLLAQLPGDFVVRVAAHSASPIFSQQSRQLAFALHQRQAIDLETLVELTDPPLADILRAKARRIAKAQGEKTEKVLALKEREVRAKEERALK
jgi:hypothetical protein